MDYLLNVQILQCLIALVGGFITLRTVLSIILRQPAVSKRFLFIFDNLFYNSFKKW